MTSGAPQSDWSDVVHVFLELRQQGGTLSATDLAVLLRWQETLVDPGAVIEKMRLLADRLELQQKPYPSTLKGLELQIKKMGTKR